MYVWDFLSYLSELSNQNILQLTNEDNANVNLKGDLTETISRKHRVNKSMINQKKNTPNNQSLFLSGYTYNKWLLSS